jgi:LPS-assembly protein
MDSGMTLEREFNALEREYVQTLEPRIYYVNIPYREQNMPKFDSAIAPFSFVQMFTENRFLGSDRIGDADQVTAALTSRLLDGETGNERLRVAIGERFSRQTPKVFLDAPTTTNSQSDVLVSVGGRMSRTLSLDSLAQYNPNESRTEMFVATARYLPEAGKVLNLGYRYTFNPDPALVLKQLDISTQWPFYGRWHMVAQSQYSLQEYRTVQALLGLEYYQDCWAVRIGARQFVTALREVSTTIFIQLELNELIRVGDDALSSLRASVPGYSALNDAPRPATVKSSP